MVVHTFKMTANDSKNDPLLASRLDFFLPSFLTFFKLAIFCQSLGSTNSGSDF